MITIATYKKHSIRQIRRMLSYYVHVLLTFLFVCFSVGCTSTTEKDKTNEYALGVGESLPSFTVPVYDINGFIGNISTIDLKGKKTIVVLFNTNCKDCQQELPVLQQLYESIDKSAVNLLLIARAEQKEDIIAYWQENGLTMPFSPQSDKTIYELFASSIIPRTYICNKECKVIAAYDDNPTPTLQQLQDAE